MYQRLSEVRTESDVEEIRAELTDRYGEAPKPVATLLQVAAFRAHARAAGLSEVTGQGSYVRFGPVELADSGTVRLQRLYPKSIVKPAVRTILVPRPATARVGGTTLRDEALLEWCREVIDSVVVKAPVVSAG
jgi:transcription-repair coupling factor (superfamily II helicase)